MLREKDIQKVLKYCFDNVGNAGVIYRPKNFANNFANIKEDDVFAALKVLDSRGLIAFAIADLPDSDNIHVIEPLPAGMDYLVQKNEERRNYWKNWRWNIWAAVVTAIIAAILGAALSRVCDILWPINPQTILTAVQQIRL